MLGSLAVAGCASKQPVPDEEHQPGEPKRGYPAGADIKIKETKDELPSLESRLSEEWLADASTVRFPKTVVFYKGTSENSKLAPNTMIVKGDIVLLYEGSNGLASAVSAVAAPGKPSASITSLILPKGTLTIGPDSDLKWDGRAKMETHAPTERLQKLIQPQ